MNGKFNSFLCEFSPFICVMGFISIFLHYLTCNYKHFLPSFGSAHLKSQHLSTTPFRKWDFPISEFIVGSKKYSKNPNHFHMRRVMYY